MLVFSTSKTKSSVFSERREDEKGLAVHVWPLSTSVWQAVRPECRKDCEQRFVQPIRNDR
jgi:hypothetical protein